MYPRCLRHLRVVHVKMYNIGVTHKTGFRFRCCDTNTKPNASIMARRPGSTARQELKTLRNECTSLAFFKPVLTGPYRACSHRWLPSCTGGYLTSWVSVHTPSSLPTPIDTGSLAHAPCFRLFPGSTSQNYETLVVGDVAMFLYL